MVNYGKKFKKQNSTSMNSINGKNSSTKKKNKCSDFKEDKFYTEFK